MDLDKLKEKIKSGKLDCTDSARALRVEYASLIAHGDSLLPGFCFISCTGSVCSLGCAGKSCAQGCAAVSCTKCNEGCMNGRSRS